VRSRERDLLARLTHPNIAQLHDGGVSDAGSPYFTLEHVEGQAITAWCDARARHHGKGKAAAESLRSGPVRAPKPDRASRPEYASITRT